MRLDAGKLDLIRMLVGVVAEAFPRKKAARKIAAAFGSIEKWQATEPVFKAARDKIDQVAESIRAGQPVALTLDDAEILALDDVLDAAGKLGKKAKAILGGAK